MNVLTILISVLHNREDIIPKGCDESGVDSSSALAKVVIPTALNAVFAWRVDSMIRGPQVRPNAYLFVGRR